MMEFVSRRFRNKQLIGAEIGVFQGVHACSILKEMLNVRKLYLVDPYKSDYWLYTPSFRKLLPKAKKIAVKKMRRFNPKRYKWVFKRFEDKVIPETLDFIYIDACHSYEAVTHDILEAEKVVKYGGVIGGHDYHEEGVLEERYGVGRAVRDHYDINRINNIERDWWVIH